MRAVLSRRSSTCSGGEQDAESTDLTVPGDELVRLIAQYFPDQRQIRNIRNEFSMYREQLLQPGRHPAELTPDRLLALVLYKNFEVADFERIRLGEGQLHRVLGFSRKLVTANLERINARLNTPSDSVLQGQAEEVGARVKAQAAALGLQFQYPPQSIQHRTVHTPMTDADLGGLEFWRKVAAGDPVYYTDGKALYRKELETAFRVSLDFAAAEPAPLDEIERRQLEDDRAFLEQATWAKLWAAPKFTFPAETKTGVADLETETDMAMRSFAQIAVDVLGEGLAADIIVEGHLTQNFALLSASFSDSFLGIEAQDFVTRVMEQPERRPLNFISQSAIKEIVAEKGEAILERAGMVNIHVLNHLLVEQSTAVPRLIRQLRSWTEQDQAVLRDFFKRYGPKAPIDPLHRMIEDLIELAPGAVGFFAVDAAIPEDQRTSVLNTAISHVRIGTLPESTAESTAVQKFAREKQQDLKSLSEEGETGTRSAHCLVQLGIRIKDVVPLSTSARNVLVPRGMFTLTMPNLQALIGQESGSWISLESLREHEDVYRSTLPRVDEYLDLGMDNVQGATASSPEALSAILTDLKEHLAASDNLLHLLRRVTTRAEKGATVEDITGLDGPVQDALLFEQRAAPTTGNLLARFASAGEFTESVAHALHDTPLPTIDDESEDLSILANEAVKASRLHPELLTADIVSQFVTGVAAEITLDPGSVLEAEDSVAIRLIDEERLDVTAMRTAAMGAMPAIAWKVREILLSKEPAPDHDS